MFLFYKVLKVDANLYKYKNISKLFRIKMVAPQVAVVRSLAANWSRNGR